MKERKTKMAKITTHRDPIRRAARIETRAKKRVETAMRKKLMKMRKINRAALTSVDLENRVSTISFG